ncbi:cytidine and deoxycytidylate deaminase [Fragilaria crotonensis]|nr:cytidine and deoxycytidylate deaminase [Fragilaria crotonensis]
MSTSRTIAIVGVTAVLAGISAFVMRKATKNSNECEVTVTMPSWVKEGDFYERDYETDDDRMALAIELSATNVEKKTGGPFGAAIFEKDLSSGKYKLISLGMNQVVPLTNSTLHGETVAIQMAQRKLGTYSLAKASGKKEYELYTSCEPCCMCIGATLWSGVSRLVCAATKDDAGAIGFDEGPVFEQSYEHLENAGVRVTRGLLRTEGAAVLKHYGEIGEIYNR